MPVFGIGNLVDRRKVEVEIASGEREKKMPAPQKDTESMTREERGEYWDKKLGKAAGAVARNIPTSKEVGTMVKETAGQAKEAAVNTGKAIGEAMMNIDKAPEVIRKEAKGYGLTGFKEAEAKKEK